jgi:hypothetical protein
MNIYKLTYVNIGAGVAQWYAAGLGLDDRGFESQQEVGIFLFTTASKPALKPIQPPIQWVRGTLSRGVKRQGSESDHSPPSSAEVKNEWRYTSTLQYAFMAWCSVKHMDNFTFYIYIA